MSKHIFKGNCPDNEQDTARDLACPACREMLRAEFDAEQPSLRDQFAMAALTGLLESDSADHEYDTSDAASEAAYEQADAMLAARAKPTEPEADHV